MQNTPLPTGPTLRQGLGFWEATAINITQIVGAGVFATIPLILGALPGPYALLAWLVAGVLILADGMIWGELGAAMPAAGGSYHFLLNCFGATRWGRLMAFLFVWQILVSGPLEVGSGLVAAAQFSKTTTLDFKEWDDTWTTVWEWEIQDEKKIGITLAPSRFLGFGMGLVILFLLNRKIDDLGRISLFFLVGILGVIAWVLVGGAFRFDPQVALDTTITPSEMPTHFGLALGTGMGLAIYSYFGYYNICYLGGEVRNPARTIPLSILTSALVVVLLFSLVHLAIVGTIPWREAKTYESNITAEFLTRIHGPWAGSLVSILLMGSCFASAFSGMLGYSRVPFAAAQQGHFFKWFDAIHPVHQIPHRSLFLIGFMVLFWSFFNLDMIITALIATRILEQFIAQTIGLMVWRSKHPGRALPWRMWFYPLPCLIALSGWLYLYITTGRIFMLIGAATLVLGGLVFLIWSWTGKQWPFGDQTTSPATNGHPSP